MISVKVIQLNPNRLKKLRTELGYLTSESFFRTIPLADFESKILDFLKNHSPESKGNSYREYLTYLGYRQAGSKDSLMSFKDGWRVRRDTEGSKVSFTAWNLLETIGGTRGELKFKSIEYGSNTTTWIANRLFRFKIENEWVTIARGRSVVHKGNEGAEVQSKAAEYIERELVPEIAQRVQEAVARRLS